MRINKILLVVISCLAFGQILPLGSMAQTPGSEILFAVTTTGDYWNANSDVSKDMTSRQPMGGVVWTTHAFTKQLNVQGLWCGLRDIPYVATISSAGAVKQEIGKVAVNMYYKGDGSYIDRISLAVSESADFTSCRKIDAPAPASNTGDCIFEIEDPQPDRYYRLEISFSPYENDCISVINMNFYGPGESDPASVESLTDQEREGKTEWFDLQGQRVDSPARGCYLMVSPQGVRKVIKK